MLGASSLDTMGGVVGGLVELAVSGGDVMADVVLLMGVSSPSWELAAVFETVFAKISAALAARASKSGLPGRRRVAVIRQSGQTQSSRDKTPASLAVMRDLNALRPTHSSW